MPNGSNLPVPYQPPAPYYPPYQPPIIYTTGGGKSSGNTALTLGIVAITLVGGGLAIWWVLKGNKKTIVNLKDYTIVVTKLTPSIPKGGTAQIKVDITNKTADTLAPTLRFDMWPSSWGHTPIEGEPVSVGDIEAGETVSTTISYELPSDWGSGSTLNSQLMLIGLEAPIWTSTFTVTPEGQVISIDPTAEGVEAINPRIVVGSRATAKVNATINNLTAVPVPRSFRLDLKKGSDALNPAPGWNNGTPKAFTLQPGPNTLLLESIPVPADWGTSNSPVAVKIMDMGQTAIFWGDLGGSDAYRIFELVGTEAQAFLKVTSPLLAGFAKKCVAVGEAFSYSFSVQNTGTAPISADFIVGWRTQGYTDRYTELSTTKSIPVGVSTQTVKSKVTTQTWSGNIVDLRVLVRKGASIIVTNDQGDATSEDGVSTDIIYEGDKVGYIGPSQLIMASGESFVDSMVPADRRVLKTGQAVSFNMRFNHIGPAKNYKVGVWVKTNEGTTGGYWIGPATFNCLEHTAVTLLETTLAGQFRATTLKAGTIIDCLFAFMEATVIPADPPQTQQFLFLNHDSILTVKA